MTLCHGSGKPWRPTGTGYHTGGHFTVVCSVTWPVNGNEAGGDLVLIQTSAFLI